jgi:ParB/RepB/Spo0J family partition protein
MPDLKVAGGFSIRRLFRIDPSLIVVSTGENSRADSERDIEALAQSFLDFDQQEPCGVRRLTDGKVGEEERVKLTFGFRRYFAAMRINEKNLIGKYRTDGQPFKLLCVVSDQEDDEQAFLSTLTENGDRKDLTPIDYAARVIPRLESFGRTRAEIAGILKKSQGWVSETLSLLDLPPWCQGYVGSGVLAVSTAYDIVKLPGPERAAILRVVKERKGQISRGQIQSLLEPSIDSNYLVRFDGSEARQDQSEPHGSATAGSFPATSATAPLNSGGEGGEQSGPREFGDGPTEQPNNFGGDQPAAPERPSPPTKREPVKALRLKPRTTKELREIAQGKAEDEEAPANVRKAAELLGRLLLRKISDKKYFSELEGLLKSRPV